MSFQQRVSDENAILMMFKYFFLLQHHSTCTVNGSRNFFTFKLSYILMAIRAIVVTLILMKAHVKLSTMLDNRFIQRRQQHMVFVIQFRNGDNKQSMVFARIAINDCSAMVSSGTIRTKHFLWKGFF